jgi:hypothetical protein
MPLWPLDDADRRVAAAILGRGTERRVLNHMISPAGAPIQASG